MYAPLLVTVFCSFPAFVLTVATQSLDVFHVFVNTRRSRLLENTSAIKPRTEDDWETEDASEASSGLLSPLTPQQKAMPVVYCELSRIGACWFYSILRFFIIDPCPIPQT